VVTQVDRCNIRAVPHDRPSDVPQTLMLSAQHQACSEEKPWVSEDKRPTWTWNAPEGKPVMFDIAASRDNGEAGTPLETSLHKLGQLAFHSSVWADVVSDKRHRERLHQRRRAALSDPHAAARSARTTSGQANRLENTA
jgi:hypothetical protein